MSGKAAAVCYNLETMKNFTFETQTIARIEWARLEGTRPRTAGSKARLGPHGQMVRLPLVRITDSDGVQGFGTARITLAQAEGLLNRPLSEAFDEHGEIAFADFLSVEYPLYDLAGKRAAKPVYALRGDAPVPQPLTVSCYDTSLYFDDLHIENDDEAAQFIANEARDGLERGHRNFKIKVGRGAHHMEQNKGLHRDIAIVRAVREVAGPDADLMIDANNGWNLNLTKTVLEETADCKLLWLEEAFHEDAVLYRDLKEWMATREIKTLIADGEGDASPHLVRWAQADGLIDVLQYDVFSSGFSFWLALGRQLSVSSRPVCTAPHHYGMHLGNYVTGHLAPHVPRLLHVEWDETQTPGIDGSAYRVTEGQIRIPDAPGFGIGLDEAVWQAAVKANGGSVGR